MYNSTIKINLNCRINQYFKYMAIIIEKKIENEIKLRQRQPKKKKQFSHI